MQLVHRLPNRLARAVASYLPTGEAADVLLWGGGPDVPVCTPHRVQIVKSSLLQGSRVFQTTYASITSVDVAYRATRGYIEVTTGGVAGSGRDPYSLINSALLAPNCVTIREKRLVPVFNAAASLILERSPAGKFAAT